MGAVATEYVCVVSHDDEAGIAEEIVLGLAKVGFQPRRGLPTIGDRAIVVVLSESMVRSGFPALDPEDLPGARLVPVAVGRIDAAGVPDYLATLNWIPWQAERFAEALGSVAQACRSDVDDYRAWQSLLARAEGWKAAGCDRADLVADRRQLAQLNQQWVVVPQRSRTAFPVMGEFLAASSAETSLRHRRRIRRRVVWVVVISLLMAAVVQVETLAQYLRDRQKLDALALTVTDQSPFASVQALKLMSLAILREQHDEAPDRELIRLLTGFMSQPWPKRTWFMAPDGTAVVGVAMGLDGAALWGSGGGMVWEVDAVDRATRRGAPGVGQIFRLDATGDLATWAAGGPEGVVVERSGQQTRFDATVGGGGDLVLARDASLLAVSADTSVRVWELGDNSAVELPEYKPGSLLGIGRVDDTIAALDRVGGRLELRDLRTGEIVRRYPDVASELAIGAVGPKGQVAVAGKDGRLWVASGGEIRPIAMRTTDLLASLAVTSTGLVLATPKGGITEVIDLETGAPRGAICRDFTARWLRLSADHRTVICSNGAGWNTYSLNPYVPVGRGAESVGARSVTVDGMSVSIEDGVLYLTTPEGERRLSVAGRRPAGAASVPHLQVVGDLQTVTLAPSGRNVAFGSETGSVVVADIVALDDIRPVLQWQSPDGSPVQVLAFDGEDLVITTTTATWRTPACAGCAVDLAVLKRAFRSRMPLCYPTVDRELVPLSVQRELGVLACEEG